MRDTKFKLRTVLLTTSLLFSVGGCATSSTLSQPVHERKPLIMSGSRLDVASLLNEPDLKAKFGVAPPDYPLLDLPFSVFFDLMALGYTLPAALFYGR